MLEKGVDNPGSQTWKQVFLTQHQFAPHEGSIAKKVCRVKENCFRHSYYFGHFAPLKLQTGISRLMSVFSSWKNIGKKGWSGWLFALTSNLLTSKHPCVLKRNLKLCGTCPFYIILQYHISFPIPKYIQSFK